MAKKKSVETKVETHVETKSVSKVTVTWNKGVREYSLAVHGENFLDLAGEFAKKHGGTVK